MSKEYVGSPNAPEIQKGLYKVSEWLGLLSAIGLAGMTALTVADVAGRYFFNSPIFGTHELVGMLLVITGTLGMAICERDGDHIAISLIVDMMPLGIKKALRSLSLFISFSIYTLITYKMIGLGYRYAVKSSAGASEELGISLAPVVFVFAIGTGMYTLVLLLHLLLPLFGIKRR